MGLIKDTYPSRLLEDAVEAIGSLPGVGKRSALRLALHLLRQPSENVHRFTDAINHLRDDARYCKICFFLTWKDRPAPSGKLLPALSDATLGVYLVHPMLIGIVE
ncbi:MAG: hypothetical protein II637_02360, partial [Bacteroidales bacterium]|nr:hypothetical protein [Bacteroidales bacterium]